MVDAETVAGDGIELAVGRAPRGRGSRHDGAIYKASNFRTSARRTANVVNGKGRLRSRRMVRHHAKRSGTTQAQARAKLGLKVQRTVRRDRWFIDLGSSPRAAQAHCTPRRSL
jgi:hypothetical protein